jgi:hypothetical protein
VLDAAINAGANVVQGLNFEVEDMKQVEASARKAAMDDAKAKAESLVSAAGAKLGRPLTISEFSMGGPPMPMMAFAAEGNTGQGGLPRAGQPGDHHPGAGDLRDRVTVNVEGRACSGVRSQPGVKPWVGTAQPSPTLYRFDFAGSIACGRCPIGEHTRALPSDFLPVRYLSAISHVAMFRLMRLSRCAEIWPIAPSKMSPDTTARRAARITLVTFKPLCKKSSSP